ncbi:MnmC family methyltransferase [Pontixanthobacter aestiaquae]|uniref:Spermidine synthase n=1 Tax=Pontixanthobacter aestiaquae TaxID=1509367 RepID=A0A844Z6J8_9SPHN|nr:MnmC family methyltransferase [Pontixanthobacter aestiaquae]MDN3644732.1 MnmC family methyltransferase [Pontixanthobacter aestiaquae]MXO84261.1 spermidine synthase [Pontixanthobacter aestiaquae]
MLERKLIDSAEVPGGATLELIAHGRDHMITLERNELMSTRMQYSEEQLAELTIDRMTAPKPNMLIGGYGMGFTLRAALARLGPDARVVVAELVPKIIEWAQGPMAHHTGDCLADPRLSLEITDVADPIGEAADGMRPQFDAILLDVDNGPDGLVREENDKLYSPRMLRQMGEAMAPGGVLSIWSAAQDPRFTRRLEKNGFDVEVREVRARPNNKGPRHTIWFARV